jgi:hypothetical protein
MRRLLPVLVVAFAGPVLGPAVGRDEVGPATTEARVTPERFYEVLGKEGRWKSAGGTMEVSAAAVRGSTLLRVTWKGYQPSGQVAWTMTARKGKVVADPKTGRLLLGLQAGEAWTEMSRATFAARSGYLE